MRPPDAATVASSLKMFLDELKSEEEDGDTVQVSNRQGGATHRSHPHTFGVTQEVKELVDRKAQF